MKLPELTFDEVSEAIAYNPETGIFNWKVDVSNNVKKGSVAGTVKNCRHRTTGQIKSYLYIRYKDREMVGSRIAWLLTYGEWPDKSVQFIDGNTTNLQISNLKLAMFKSNSVTVNGRKTRKMSKEASRHYGLKRFYGLTLTEFADMYKFQNGVCAICKQKETAMVNGQIKDLSVDHSHVTGKNRELLCSSCNHLLGHAKENIQTLLAAAAYLEKHSANSTN